MQPNKLIRFILSAIAVMLLLSGCKATVNTQVNLTDLLSSKTKTISGDLYVVVPSCNNYEDSRKPSDSLIKAQQTIPNIFTDAKYIECFSKEFDSMAHFSIPITLDKNDNGKLASPSHVNIISNSKTLLTLGIPRSIHANMEKVKEDSFGTDTFELKVNIKIHNDTGKEFRFRVISAYISGEPNVYSNLVVNANGQFVVTLSDVSVDQALQRGQSPVLLH